MYYTKDYIVGWEWGGASVNKCINKLIDPKWILDRLLSLKCYSQRKIKV